MAEPECRTTSRHATIPPGSRTRSELTLKAGPLKTVFDERTSTFVAERDGVFDLRLLVGFSDACFLDGMVSPL
jgi:hypothetical protein